MRSFWLTLLASIVASIVLWNAGVAHEIWPAHPLLVTVVLASIFGTLVQNLTSRNTAQAGSQSRK